MANNTSTYFSRGGVIFTALLFNCLQTMSEITKGYAQRPIVIRHSRFAFLHPAADALADTLLDIPIRLVSLTLFVVILYFMTNLAQTADQFFIFYGIVVLTTFTMAAFFRMLAAIFQQESAATMVAGIAVIDMVLYAGYAIPRPSMVVWWKVSGIILPLFLGPFDLLTDIWPSCLPALLHSGCHTATRSPLPLKSSCQTNFVVWMGSAPA